MDVTIMELRERAEGLRSDALRLLQDTGILDVARAGIGSVEIVGSVDLDLMVWPDIDLYTRLGTHEGARLLALLPALHEGVEARGYALVRVSFNDEYRRPGNAYGSGLYCGMKILDPAGDRLWKVDLWAWDPAAFDRRLAAHHQLAHDLAAADRGLILQVKHAVHLRPEYRHTLTSMDVYAFAIEGRGRTLREFDEFVARRGDPAEGASGPARRVDG
jgi:hypothetical protein